jgi:hypothetical protein
MKSSAHVHAHWSIVDSANGGFVPPVCPTVGSALTGCALHYWSPRYMHSAHEHPSAALFLGVVGSLLLVVVQ